ncbi:acetoin utilization transport system permease protein [Psychrobacillus sp. OK028]|uniref:ABC transporter permease n=1 Tax=Psychrobacillus sp. OK028 TaxID=1884359 RepID=UPI00087E7B5F|nr:FtsX-like permease family protein [Psychrobacillus sp. OK028]SDN42888.1 acetoin utilization transport system permease protein [Psychrobacillus sp. OK028]
MLFKDQVDFVRQHIKKNKLRVFMTILAATMGCAFLIVLASIGFGIQDTMRKEILQDQAITEVEVYPNENEELNLEEIKSVPYIGAIVQRTSMDVMTSFHLEDRSIQGNLLLTDMQEEEQSNLKLSEGRLPQNESEIVVGYHFAQNLWTDAERAKVVEEEADLPKGYEKSIIGKTVTLSLQPYDSEDAFSEQWEFTVVGVVDIPARDWIIDQSILMDKLWLSKLKGTYEENAEQIPENFTYTTTKIYTDSLEHVKSVTKDLKDMGYNVYSVSEQLEQIDVFFMAFKIGLIFVGTIAVLISSIGIFNTMTMAVTERTREIGVMKAIGASPKLIQRLFLMESAWIGIIGTVLAVIISYAVSYLANWILPMVVGTSLGEDGLQDLSITFSLIPWQLVVLASTISIGVAMISGWRPARKATKIDVIQALRQEL